MERAEAIQDLAEKDGWKIWASRAAEAIVGVVLLAAGFLKGIDMVSFVKQIGDYKIVSSPILISTLAWVLIVVEFLLGTALIVGFKRRVAVPASLALMMVFIGALTWAWATGATVDCGCFGRWAERTPATAIVEDIFISAGLVAAWILHRKELPTYQLARLISVIAVLTIGVAISVVKSLSPEQSSDPAIRLQVIDPVLFRSIKISGLEGSEAINQGTALVALIDTGCDHCQASVPTLNERFSQNLVPLFVLCPNTEAEVAIFKEKFKASFSIGRISDEDFLKLLERGDTPRLFLLKDGKVTKIWEAHVPTEAELKSAMTAAESTKL
ncbi:MAG: hypothetical protein JNN15_12950 [Blastocatellia bacterium]|nr:hypothetical protein [Blastocatellia bacterium]